MRIQKIRNQTNYQSLNNPISPFFLNTKKGGILISEIPAFHLRNDKFLTRILHFFCKNFASKTNDPYWLGFKHPQNRKPMIQFYANYLREKNINDDGNMTMLTAINEAGKLCGGCLSYNCNKLLPEAKNTCYIEALAVDDKYRGCKLGDVLLNTTINANKNSFTDIFLKGEMLATGFYQKMGFEIMSEKNEKQKNAVALLAAQGEGYPEYIQFFTKHIQKDKPEWFECIKKS